MMGSLFKGLLLPFLKPLLKPFVRPAARVIAGLIAIPLFRRFRRDVVRLQDLDEELEKDIDEWFRGALLLLLATANMERSIGDWLNFHFDIAIDHWWVVAGRLLLAVGVIEAMPDQELFAIIHSGPPRPYYDRALGLVGSLKVQAGPMFRGLCALHLKRSSPVFVIMAAIFHDTVGWVCYFLAIIQYLIIGLITSRDKALDLLTQFDRQVAERRRDLIEEFHLESPEAAPASPAAEEGTLVPRRGTANRRGEQPERCESPPGGL